MPDTKTARMSPGKGTAGPEKIISGGQTGVDRAALDAAIRSGITPGGWCPSGRLAEDGRIPDTYPLMPTPTADYRQRTEWNVRDADATLILHRGGPLSGGTLLTRNIARRLAKPCLVYEIPADPDPSTIRTWLDSEKVRVLNIAGPRESNDRGIYDASLELLLRLFSSSAGH